MGGTLYARKKARNPVSDIEFEIFISQAEESMKKYPEFQEDNIKADKLREILRFAYYYNATKNFTKKNLVQAMDSAEKYLALYPKEPNDKSFLALKADYTKNLARYKTEKAKIAAEKAKIAKYNNVSHLYSTAVKELAAENIDGALDTAKRAFALYPKEYAKQKHAKDDLHILYEEIQSLLLKINTVRAKLHYNSPARSVYQSAPTRAPRTLKPTRLTKSLMTKFGGSKPAASLGQSHHRNKKFTGRK